MNVVCTRPHSLNQAKMAGNLLTTSFIQSQTQAAGISAPAEINRYCWLLEQGSREPMYPEIIKTL